MMTNSENQNTIGEIPFPMVTICPITKTSKDQLDLDSVYYHIQKFPMLNNLSELQ